MIQLTRLKSKLAEICDLKGAASVLGWDQQTYMPPGGASARAEQLATLEKLSHEMFISAEMGERLEGAARSNGSRDLCRASRARARSVPSRRSCRRSAASRSARRALRLPSCDLARQLMLANLAPLGIRLSDSVTTKLPVAIHRKGRLNKTQIRENQDAVYDGWREHFTKRHNV